MTIVASDEVKEHRMKICRACPNLKNPDSRRCRCALCGCFMEAKTRIIQAKCPDGKW